LQINIEFKQHFLKNEATKDIINAFGLASITNNVIVKDFEFNLEHGKLYYICGYSGSGKSSLLNAIYDNIKTKNTIYIKQWNNIKIDNKPLIEFFPNIDSDDKIRILSKCGLGEAWKFVSKYNELSDGEKFRFVFYHSIMSLAGSDNPILIFDEFCATLDRVTAKSICNNIKKMAKIYNITIILASAHDDIMEYLDADYNIIKEFDENVELQKGKQAEKSN
tara:strand:+ start:4668 stop:5330 length:663 start_codon:yes stop_codon:yes gene_type:complete